MTRIRIMAIIGTRPEVIKLAPVVAEARRRPDAFEVTVVRTGQQREMADRLMADFALSADVDLGLAPPKDLANGMAACCVGLSRVMRRRRPDWVLVQGDTTSCFAGAMAAAYLQIAVGHVEAGVRSGNCASPFPEEIHRCLTAQISALHFAPTAAACVNLRREGVPAERIALTGNTGIDALFQILGGVPGHRTRPCAPPSLLLTLHRRESYGRPMEEVCEAVLELLDGHPDLQVVFPVHANPKVRGVVWPKLVHHPRVQLTEPLPYRAFVEAMHRATLILSDSGGVQEEAPALGKPVLVLREVTDRAEAVEAGVAVMVGSDRRRIVDTASHLLRDGEAYRRMAAVTSPFGDGRAAGRILDRIELAAASVCTGEAAETERDDTAARNVISPSASARSARRPGRSGSG